MDDMSLKKKIIEWLQLRKAVETLEKAGIHDQHSMAPQGQSVAGHDYRVGKQIQQEGHPDHLGFLKAALDSHKRKLDVLKQQPKPNLPKAEKAEEKGVHPVTRISGQSPSGEAARYHTTGNSEHKASSGNKMMARMARQGHEGKLAELKSMPKPNLTRAEVIPADVSAPVIQNRVDMNGPKIIDQPNIVNPYKEIFGALKNKKGE